MLDKLPDSLILRILEYCEPPDVCHIGQLSRTLHDVCSDQLLWRIMFHRYFQLRKFQARPFGQGTWKSEFIRLHDEVPIVECEVSVIHEDEVLHVSFSHDGKRFATAGKDAYIRVWNTTTCPVELEFAKELKNSYRWRYAQFSQFNETDTLLLVSGVKSVRGYNVNGGEIIIFDMRSGDFVCRSANRPYDVFGIWCSDEYFLTGGLKWLAPDTSKTEIWLNKASQETRSEHKAVLNSLYKFYNIASSSIRTLLVADVPALPELTPGERVIDLTACHCSRDANLNPSPGSSGNASPTTSEGAQLGRTNRTIQDRGRSKRRSSDDENISEPCSSKNFKSTDMDNYDEDDDVLDKREKLLIFTCGSLTHTPHQIGFKRMGSCNFEGKVDPGPSLSERIQLLAEQKRRRAEAEAHGAPDPGYANYERVVHLFDKYDATIDLKGHIVGMTLSPDHRYLYVNCRSWPAGAIISDPGDPPPVAQEIDIHVVDLTTFTIIGNMPTAHRGYTPNDECFFLFLDASEQYLASGSEDLAGVVWDRNYEIPLCRLPHTSVVNSVALNPVNPQMLVSGSDDQSIKVWRSKRLCRELGIDYKARPLGTFLFNNNRH